MALRGDAVTGKFNEMLSSPSILVITMLLITIAGFLICSVGLQNGVERVTKVMMIVLMVVMIFLAVYSFTMPGAKEGLKFYLVPDKQQIEQVGLFHIITSAMSQAFFTLSLGIGAMLIFGSYLNGGKSLLGEAINIAVLDTFVAITAGLIIFPVVLFLSRTAGQRPEADLYDTAAHLHLDEGRTDFRKLFLPVSVLCGTVHYHRCIREHHVLLFRDFRCFQKTVSSHQLHSDHFRIPAVCTRLQCVVRIPAARRRKHSSRS